MPPGQQSRLTALVWQDEAVIQVISRYTVLSVRVCWLFISSFSLYLAKYAVNERGLAALGAYPLSAGREQRGERDGIGWAALGQVSRQTVFSGPRRWRVSPARGLADALKQKTDPEVGSSICTLDRD